MKQLKFMIAATAAIGLAGVAQAVSFSDVAAANGKDALSNTGFEDLNEGSVATTGLDDYFLYTGTQAADNESAIIADNSVNVTGSLRAKGAKFDAKAKVLQVNTGTDPLLRTLGAVENGDSSAVDIPDGGLYIDTLVQFTVTPAGDTVTPGEDDKLMIYLQEVAATETTAAATNLMVLAGYWNGDNIESKPYVLKNAQIEAGKWYRLTVKAIQNITGDSGTVIAGFTVSIDNDAYTANEPVVAESFFDDFGDCIDGVDTKHVFPSLKSGANTLKAVGFAGEGLVDDIVFSTTLDELVTAIDFTFTWGDGISGVTYVIGTDTDNPATAVSGTAFKVEPGKQITVTVTAADWYKYEGDSVFTAGNEGETVALEATKLAEAAADGTVTVSAATAPADLGVKTGSFAGAASADVAAELSKAMTWAMKKGGASTATAAANVVNGLNFAEGDEDTDAEKAYLLNCTTDELTEALAAFKFVSFDPATPPTAEAFAEKDYNGTVTIKGAAELGEWGDVDANSKFFKAVLTK